MDESKQKDSAGCPGACDCKDFQPPYPFPGDRDPIRRLIKAIEDELETYADKPTDAVKKLGEDLKSADKEYLGISTIFVSYEKFYDKLDCLLADASRWKSEIAAWCTEKVVDPNIHTEIQKLRDKYSEKEKDRCCKWINDREKLKSLKDCSSQATFKVEEALDDFTAYKVFEKTLTDRFAELKALFEKAAKLRAEEKHQSVCAVGLEFNALYEYLSVVVTWKIRVEECGKTGPATGGDLKTKRSPEKLKDDLMAALRALILAQYQRFRWAQYILELLADSKKNKEACDAIKATRKDEFIQEAEDVKPPSSSSNYTQKTAA